MKKFLCSALSLACLAAASALHGLGHALGLCAPPTLARGGYAEPPTLPAFNELRRRDLLQGHMPEQPAPREQATRVTRDQRPGLRAFTLPRTEFAFPG